MALVALGTAACGRLGFDGLGSGSGSGSGSNPVATHVETQVCGVQSWSSVTASLDLDISVATTPTGATVFSVPTSSGALAAFNVDGDGNLTSAASGSTIRNDGPYTASAAAYVDGKLIAAVVSGTRVLVNVVDPALGSYTEIANVDGEYVGKQALLDLSTARITPTSCSAGLTVNPFDSNWTAMSSQLSVTTSQSIGINAIAVGGDVLAAWSTASECYVEQIVSSANGTGSMQSYPCNAARLLTDGANAAVVFESTDGVHLASIAGDQLAAASRLLAPGATAPRALFDGAATWVSYLDSAGDVHVGFFDAAGNVVETNLAGPRPTSTAYELALIGGAPWIVDVDASGFAGYKICAVTVPN
jgi:hypothetical protein